MSPPRAFLMPPAGGFGCIAAGTDSSAGGAASGAVGHHTGGGITLDMRSMDSCVCPTREGAMGAGEEWLRRTQPKATPGRPASS